MSPADNKQELLLLVDDVPSNLHVLAGILKHNYRLKLATSGLDAIALCHKEDQPQLIIMDIMMPGMSGMEVLRHLQADKSTSNIPVIFLSADSTEESQLDGLDLGANDYLTKPVNGTLLQARIRNILRRKLAEDQVRELNATLEQKISERTEALEATTAALQASLEELSRSEAKAALSILIASITHELGTPLGNSVVTSGSIQESINAFEKLISSGQLKRSDMSSFLNTLHEGHEILQRNLRRANELLSNFKQVAADQASEQRREFDLAKVVQEIIASLRPSLKRQPHRIELDIPSGLKMDSLPGPLGQICINLINNAWLHAFEGINEGRLAIHGHQEADEIVLRFEDNGVGIPPENLERMFQPFFSTKIGKGGTGLGMSIVHSLTTETLKGSLEVTSTPGKGSCFSLRLPCRLPSNQAQAQT